MKTNIQNKRAVILTGTIIPNSVYTNQTDPLSRLEDYHKAIRFYREELKMMIFFYGE
ncbi:MAG: hypothetical protein IM600_07405 [Bacteroidetes bacterium]|nr:hypothetical protein [Bacteroidota bacterium]MCA6443235.1 hypothetical protein [Bacteroidota bacterium]